VAKGQFALLPRTCYLYEMFHYTKLDGFNGIRSQPEWTFKAAKPPGGHPIGAYFTPLSPEHYDELCEKLLIPNEKIEYCFEFTGGTDLKPIRGGRGRHIIYSEVDYVVIGARQVYHGKSIDWGKETERDVTQ